MPEEIIDRFWRKRDVGGQRMQKLLVSFFGGHPFRASCLLGPSNMNSKMQAFRNEGSDLFPCRLALFKPRKFAAFGYRSKKQFYH